jgi:hypothetical protein
MSTDHVSSQDENLQTPATVDESRRGLFRKAAIIGGAAVAGGAMLGKTASAADGDDVLVGGTYAADTATEIYYDPAVAAPFPAGPSVISGGEGASPLQQLFTAGVGGYAVEQVVNGVHGSTTVAEGFGVVAANGFTPVADTDAPKALALGSLGSHVQFLTPAAVATAIGLVDYPAQVGPSLGDHGPGELVVDDAYNLWFSVPGAAVTDPVRWIRLAGPQTAGSFVPLPVAERVLDTRSNNGAKVANNATVQVDMTKKADGTDSSLPDGAVAVLVNLTLDATELTGFHRAYSADATLDPDSPFSSINWDDDSQIRANLSVVALGRATAETAGAIKVTSGGGGSTHLIIDLLGYYL